MKKLLFLVFVLSYSLWAKETLILSIHSYHESYIWTKTQHQGFIEYLKSVPDLYPIYSTEYLDTKRRSLDQDYENELVHYMRNKYKDYRPDIIYVSDDNALNFMIHNKAKLFPSVPVVFSGINNQSAIDKLPKDSYTGVREEKEILPNIELIKTLFPKEHDLLILGDGSSTSEAIRQNIAQYLPVVKGMTIHYINEENFESVIRQLKAYKGKNIILTTIGGFHSLKGQLVPLNEAIHDVVNAGDFHIFSMEDSYIQQGVIGGHADSGVIQGQKAGEIALQILSHPDAPLPHIDEDNNGWIFDSEALKQHNIILPSNILAQSTLLNPPQSFYNKNEELITNILYLLAITVFLGSLTFIIYLFWSRKTIAKRESELLILSDSLNKAQTLAHLGNWSWDIQANTLWWSDEIYRIFGLHPQEFKANYEAFLLRVHPDDREKVQEAVNHALANEVNYRIAHRIVQKDGTIRHVIEEGEVTYEDGKPLKMTGVVQDITIQYEANQALEKSEIKYRNLVENAMVGIYRSDLSGNILYVNKTLAALLGFNSPDELIGQKSMLTYNDPRQRTSFIKKLTEEHVISNYELELVDHQSNLLPVIISATLEGDTLSGMIIDMREIKKSRVEIENLSKVIEQIDDNVAITDKHGIITYVNQAFCDHTGYDRSEVIGKNPKILKSDHYDTKFYKKLWTTILRGDIYRETIINRKKNGDLYYENKTITPLKDDKDNLVSFVSTGKDVTAEALMHQDLERIATVDKLTGIYNRHKFEELFMLESERSRRFSQPLSLILIDIDHFKSVNDTYGHDVGDEVLKKITDVINENIRKIDIFARWGGEEFLVLSPGTDQDNIQKLAEKLRLAVEKAPFQKVKHITISLGVSTLREEDTFAELFKRVDERLYYAKEHGRNQVGAS